MRPVVVDTDVVSFLFKNDSRAQLYLPHLKDRQWLVSFINRGGARAMGSVLEVERGTNWLVAFVPSQVCDRAVFARLGGQVG